jgi:hypothetical protein
VVAAVTAAAQKAARTIRMLRRPAAVFVSSTRIRPSPKTPAPCQQLAAPQPGRNEESEPVHEHRTADVRADSDDR